MMIQLQNFSLTSTELIDLSIELSKAKIALLRSQTDTPGKEKPV